jgi:hypothetical protein
MLFRLSFFVLFCFFLVACESEPPKQAKAHPLDFEKVMVEAVDEQFAILEISVLSCVDNLLKVKGMIAFEIKHDCQGLVFDFEKNKGSWRFDYKGGSELSAHDKVTLFSKALVRAITVYEFEVMDRFQKLDQLKRSRTG